MDWSFLRNFLYAVLTLAFLFSVLYTIQTIYPDTSKTKSEQTCIDAAEELALEAYRVGWMDGAYYAYDSTSVEPNWRIALEKDVKEFENRLK